MENKMYVSSLTSQEDDDWCLINEAGLDDLDSTFELLTSDDFVTERCADSSQTLNEKEVRKRPNEKKEKRKKTAGKRIKQSRGDNNNRNFKVEKERTDKSVKKGQEGKAFQFHENHYSRPQTDELLLAEDPFINFDKDSFELTNKDVCINLTNDEVVCMMDEDEQNERKKYAKVQEVEDFWLKYEYWDSNPSVSKMRRKHKRLSRRRKLMWKRNPPPFA